MRGWRRVCSRTCRVCPSQLGSWGERERERNVSEIVRWGSRDRAAYVVMRLTQHAGGGGSVADSGGGVVVVVGGVVVAM